MVRFALIVAAALLLANCLGTRSLPQEAAGGGPGPADYNLIYVIHGDGGYLYHDGNGDAVQADRKTLQEAIAVGRAGAHAEVFIFHQRPRSHFLQLFPLRESRFYHFRAGELVEEVPYFSRRSDAGFLQEAGLYHRRRKAEAGHGPPPQRIFLYFGHEIPAHDGFGYHGSMPDVPFNMKILAQGMEAFNNNGKDRFDLTVLSSCSNGSRETASLLYTQTDLLIASPEELHLSYMDSGFFKAIRAEDFPVIRQLALAFAQHAFHILDQAVHTPVSITLYDTLTMEVHQWYRGSRFGKPSTDLPAGDDVNGVDQARDVSQ